MPRYELALILKAMQRKGELEIQSYLGLSTLRFEYFQVKYSVDLPGMD